jgi:hypothetical protein
MERQSTAHCLDRAGSVIDYNIFGFHFDFVVFQGRDPFNQF